jgi:alpha,alpha-trehalase
MKFQQNAIYKVLWNNDQGAWFDYDLRLKKQRLNFYPSNVSPLWAECYP